MGLSRCSSSKTLKFVTVQKGGARSFAEFTLSGQGEILRFAQNDSEGLRMTVQGGRSEILRCAQNDSEGLRMTG